METIRQLMRSPALPRLETQMLLQHVLNVSRSWLVAHDDEALTARQLRQFNQLLANRLAGQPMAYLVGEREFGEHVFAVSPAVLIPRPETELLVETVLETLALHPPATPPARVLELGTGSGIIAISVALGGSSISVVATDISPEALSLARQNAERLGAIVEFLPGSWYDALVAHTPFDVIVSNPPYISVNDPHLTEGDLRFEPSLALTDGGDGLGAFRQIIEQAPSHLRPGGYLWLEHGWDQGQPIRQLLAEAGFQGIETRRDLAGVDRVSGGHL